MPPSRRSPSRKPAPEPPEEKVRGTTARVIRKVFDEEFLVGLAQDIRDMTTGVWAQGTCPDCGSQKKVKVEVSDIQGKLKAVAELMEQAEGRPGTDNAEHQGTVIIVERPPK